MVLIVTMVLTTNLVILCEADSPRRVEMFPHLAFKTILGQVVTIRAKQLQPDTCKVNEVAFTTNIMTIPVVPCIRYQDLVLAIASHVPRIEELSITRPLLSKLENKFSCKE